MKFLLSIILFVVPFILYAQGATDFGKPKKTNFIKYSLVKRLAFYPISESSQIKIVSFHWPVDTSNGRKETIYRIPLLNDTICLSKLDQIMALSQSQIRTLTDILYNTCYQWTITTLTSLACFLPRNAILFYDKDGKPFEYLEICFECHGISASNNKMEKPETCDLMFDNLEKYFQTLGLKTKASELMRETNRR